MRNVLIGLTLLLFGSAVGTGLQYGGLTFGMSAPDAISNATGVLKGCDRDEPRPGVKAATLCTVVITTHSTAGPYTVSQQFLFEDGLLQAVTLTAAEDTTYRSLRDEVTKEYGAMKPQVLSAFDGDRRIVITNAK
jgi:hypothetical protein